MKNKMLDKESTDILLSPERWRVVSSLWTPEVNFIHSPSHLNWISKHTEQHPAREVLFALKGQGFYGFKGHLYPCPPGTMILFNSYEPHDDNYPPNCPDVVHFWMTLFEHDVIANVLYVRDGKFRIADNQIALNNDSAANHLNTIWNELENSPAIPPAFQRAKLIAALWAMYLRLSESGFGGTGKHTEYDFQTKVIKTISRHIEKTSGKGVTLSEAARLSGYSKFHFQRLFKQHNGATFHCYVNECRLKKIKAMEKDRCTKTEISAALGFSHPSAFLRWIKTQ